MKKTYTEQDINQFFEEFKQLPNSYTIEKVHQLISNPNAQARHRVNSQFTKLKIIIMTSAFLIGAGALLIWLSPEKSVMDDFLMDNHPVVVKNSIQVKNNEEPGDNTLSNNQFIKQETGTSDVSNNEINTMGNDPAKNEMMNKSDVDDDSTTEKTCTWPIDTLLDKKSLYVYLTNSELEKLGVLLTKKSMYYENRTPDDKQGTGYKINWEGKTDMKTHHEFYMKFVSDTACTRYRWGHPFYSKIDTLVPIVITLDNNPQILWFTPHSSLFTALPTKYAYLEKVYKNLCCAKRQNPEHQFVNHWNEDRNIVLDEINFLSLSHETLKKIGFQLFEDSISLVHPSFNMHYNVGKGRNRIGASTRNTPYPPNPLPVIVTDEKGLKQNYFGYGSKDKFNQSMYDVLVPVKIPLNEFISTIDYYLIFWFYPTDEFIDALPEDIKYDLKSERNDIIEGTSKSENTCTYFEACKSTLTIDDLKVFPNPANQKITIEFTLPESLSGTISLVSISGRQVKVIASENNFNSGLNSIDANLSGVSPGVYLISISTPKGFKTQRVIISR